MGRPAVGGANGRGDADHPAGTARTALLAYLAVGQGLFYALTGVWPLVSMRTFEMVTGPKTDRWLVKTVGVLVTVIGAVLTLAGLRRRTTPEVALLAAGSAAGLTGIDVIYSARGRISKVYLLDAAAEAALILAWTVAWRRGRAGNPSPP